AASLWAAPPIAVSPERVELKGNFEGAQLLVSRASESAVVTERSDDLTTQAAYESSDPRVATVSSGGKILAAGNGQAKVTVAVDNARLEVPVSVSGVAERPQVGFSHSIRPILNKAGCAMA